MLTIDSSDVARVATKLLKYGEKMDRVQVRAINRAIGSARTVMVRAAAADTGLKASVVRDAMILREATVGRPQADLRASAKRIPLINFGATGPEPSRGKGHGVSYRLGAAGRNRLEQAFIATTGSSHRGVFQRIVASRSRKGMASPSPGLPIVELKGPSLWHVFDKFKPLGEARAREVLQDRLKHELDFASTDEYAETRVGLDETGA